MEYRNEPDRRGDDGDDDEGGFDVAVLKDYLAYALRALRIHRLVAGVVTVTVGTFAVAVVLSLPKTYHVESKLFAQKEAGVENRRTFGADPLKGIGDIMKGHDSLVALVKQLDLVTWSKENLAPIQRVKAFALNLIGRGLSDEERARGLVGMLSNDLNAWQTDATATVTLDWPDAVMAARIVDAAEQNFLEKRHVMEISTIAESVSILEEHAEKLRAEIEELAKQGRADTAAPSGAPPSGQAAPSVTPASPAAPRKAVAAAPKKNAESEADIVRQKVLIDSKQRAIADLEQFRQRRLLELQANLSDQRSKYTDAHPIIVSLKENIEATSKESPQVTALRAELKTLQDSYDAALRERESAPPSAGGGGGGSAPSPAPAPAPVGAGGVGDLAALLLGRQENRDPATEAQIQFAVAKYSEVRTQISSARIDLDLAQAAFHYRYSVVVPPEPPIAPIKPKVSVLIAAGLGVAVLLGVLAAVLAELRSGRLVARWQVERLLKGVPVLAELPYPTNRDEKPPA
ncbi:MAG TPA: hypothetical protein VHE30_29275 [Polyangiaceae bacterium]|nr:hypothetical protein [Polyangiaceae bacterium]